MEEAERADVGTLLWHAFRDEGRGFYLLVLIGSEATVQTRQQTVDLLGSFQFGSGSPYMHSIAGLVRLDVAAMAPILSVRGAELIDVSNADSNTFNPSLGLAWRGMWGISFATAFVEAAFDEDEDEPAEAPAA